MLYVGGDGGVFRSEDGGTTWTNFPNVTDTWTLAGSSSATVLTSTATSLTVNAGGPTAPTTPFTITIGTEEIEVTSVNSTTNVWTIMRGQDGTTAAAHNGGASVTNNGDNAVLGGGLLPNLDVTSLQLMTGDVNASTGLPESSTGYNMLEAGTYGQGVYAIRLDNSAVQQFPTVVAQAPQVASIAPVTSNGGATLTGITVTFNEPIESTSLTRSGITLYDPNGNLIAVLSVTTDSSTVYTLNFTGQTAVGLYSLSITGATDNAGDLMVPYAGKLPFPYSLPEAVFDFPVAGPGAGVYVYRSLTGFQQINTTNASDEAISANGDYVVVTLTTGGVWLYTEANEGWQELSTNSATLLTIDNVGDVAGYFASGYASGKPAGVYEFTSSSGFSPVATVQKIVPTLMVMDGAGDLFGEFPNDGVYEAPALSYDFSNQVSTGNATVLAADAGGDAVGEFPNVTTNPGVYEAPSGGKFTEYLSSGKASLLAMDTAGNAVGAFTSGVYETSSPGGTMTVALTSGSASLLAMDSGGDAFGQFSGGVYEAVSGGKFTTQLTLPNSMLPPTLVTQDGKGDEFAVLPNNGGAWRYTIAAGWQEVSSANPTLLVADAAGDAFGEFPNLGSTSGVYEAAAGGAFTDYVSSGQATLLVVDPAGLAFGEFPNVGAPASTRPRSEGSSPITCRRARPRSWRWTRPAPPSASSPTSAPPASTRLRSEGSSPITCRRAMPSCWPWIPPASRSASSPTPTASTRLRSEGSSPSPCRQATPRCWRLTPPATCWPRSRVRTASLPTSPTPPAGSP